MSIKLKASYVVYKKAYLQRYDPEFTDWRVVTSVIVKLRLPKGTRVNRWVIGRKCRASQAEVLGFEYVCNGKPRKLREKERVVARWDYDFVYTKGKMVRPRRSFTKDRKIICASGIHFFVKRKSAVNYVV